MGIALCVSVENVVEDAQEKHLIGKTHKEFTAVKKMNVLHITDIFKALLIPDTLQFLY